MELFLVKCIIGWVYLQFEKVPRLQEQSFLKLGKQLQKDVYKFLKTILSATLLTVLTGLQTADSLELVDTNSHVVEQLFPDIDQMKSCLPSENLLLLQKVVIYHSLLHEHRFC